MLQKRQFITITLFSYPIVYCNLSFFFFLMKTITFFRIFTINLMNGKFFFNSAVYIGEP